MARVDTSSVLTSLNMMLDSQERREATEVEQSLAAMNMAYEREQRHIENIRAEKQLGMAEAEFFENQVVGLRADIEAEANSHLNSLYTKYFKHEFDEVFAGKPDNYKSSKKQGKWAKKFNNKGAGFSDADANAIANQILVYVESGFTNHDAMRDVANMFKDKDDFEFDSQFVAAAEKFGIYSTDPGKNRMAIDDFNRVFELDDAKNKLRQERLDIAKGDTKFDYEYDALFHGEKLKPKGEEEDPSPNQTRLADLNKMIEGKQPGTPEYNMAMSKFYESIGMNISYNPNTSQWSIPGRPNYVPTDDDISNYSRLDMSMGGRKEKFNLSVNDYKELLVDINQKEAAMEAGDYFYSPEEIAHDQIKLLSLQTLNNARGSSIAKDSSIMARIENLQPELVNQYYNDKKEQMDKKGGGTAPPTIFHTVPWLAHETIKGVQRFGDWVAPAIEWIGDTAYDAVTMTEEERNEWYGPSRGEAYLEETNKLFESSQDDWESIINPKK